MFVKICGLKTEESVTAAVEAGADAIGFVFANNSSRQVDVATAKRLRQLIPNHVRVVGVFLDPTLDEVETAITCGLTDIQLHRRTLPLETFRQFNLPIIEASSKTEADIVLLDAPTPGSGETLDWLQLERPQRTFWLAGGLTADNVRQAMHDVRPDGVDVSSGVETDGEKDIDKIRTFIRRAKEETPCTHNQ
ncbi:phosphoribosylanthranilate isomerase [Exiguobacterium sp. SH31]|uniref:phosphoribosylanthranilate isomerase n=1 Tax=unclassified Exiguobacterium TaxID=2644629 RepID=UPI0008CFE3D8|nr:MULTISPECIES: phosphoribosylanthranilate isomerase [unclassified Exiguobacterium]OGX79405.1 phosphoribosylanthranilate isomerase [Exiguobacterium sp. SH31]TCI70416.1 phosphoribosylanthranilate isomerase [Exiguobacterium sp. SH0S7]